MNPYAMDQYYGDNESAAAFAPSRERVGFIRRTYAHLAVAVAAFVGIEALLIRSGVAEQFVRAVFVQKGAWLGLMILFLVGSYAAQAMARSETSQGVQYLGLALYVGLEVIIFLPILTVAETFPQFKGVAAEAGVLTLLVFAGLTVAVFASGKDFSFLGTALWVGSFLALGLVICAVAFNLGGLGLWFSFAMVALACGMIIYDTSNVLHHYRTTQHVAAALALFASVALLFFYILRILMAFANNRE